MHPNPQENETTDIHEAVHNKQQAIQRAFALDCRNLNENWKLPNAIYKNKSHGPTYKRQKVLLYHPAIAVGTNSKLADPWKGPYIIEIFLNDVIFRINA